MNCPACGLDIDEHPANRCLDAWVAKAIFGWDGQRGSPKRLWPIKRAIPYYSTYTAAAWEAVRYLSNRAIEVVVVEGLSGNLSACMMYEGSATSYPPRDAFLHLATIEQASSDFGSLCVRTQAETVPLAICRAALRVMGNEGQSCAAAITT